MSGLKILFVWTGVTSYMADCWRALAAAPGVELRLLVEPHDSGKEIDRDRVFQGLKVAFGDDLGNWTPDVIFAVGWHSPLVRSIVRRFPAVRKICCFDMPWRPKLRCVAARFVLWRYLRQFEAAYVPGAAAAKYARWLGFRQIHTGLFSFDHSRFAPPIAAANESALSNRRGFLYIGRHSSEKRLDILRRAYSRYRELGGVWKLDFYGGANFVQPAEIPAVYHAHACLLLTSEFDPWPLVVLEAKAAGLAAIVSDRCGNAAELGARAVPFGDVEAMAHAMLEFEREPRQLCRDISRYDASAWTARTLAIAKGKGSGV